MWFPTPDQIASGAKAAQEIYKALDKDLISQLVDRIWYGAPTFMVFGPGGSGKSTLKAFLETLSENELDPKYTMSKIWEPGKIKGRRFSDIKVFPGQQQDRDPQIEEHRSWFKGIRRPFIVLCFSYGYRAVDVRQASSRGAPQANCAARKEELTYADEILDKIHNICSFPRYKIFTMILKQDLWWDEKDNVYAFYENQYEPIVKKFSERSVGTNNVQHYAFPMCLIRSNLYDANGKIIKMGSGSYDEGKRRESTIYFLNTLNNLLSQG
jgi:hypothetical protein